MRPSWPAPQHGAAARRRLRHLAALGCLLSLVGCRQDMHDQPKAEPLEASGFFADGQGSRQPVSGTVARGELRQEQQLYRGMDADGRLVADLPVPLTRALVERGRQRYDIFCSPCHDRTGDGDGMIVRRGFKKPQSFHQQRLRDVPVGYFFDVMTNGFGQMSSYRSQVPVADRWAIAAYIRALQLSRNVPADHLTAEDFDHLTAAESGPPRPPAEGTDH